VLARTKNKTLELREDPIGLHFWAKVADTSYARDLKVLMERGDVDQASFAFTVAPGGDEWNVREEDGQEVVERTINKVGELFDVTVTAQGAYPQSDASVVAHMRSRVKAEIEAGTISLDEATAMQKIVAPDDPVDVSESQGNLGSDEQRIPAPEVVEDTSAQEAEEKRAEELKALRAHTRTTLELTKRRLLDAENERNRK
jgi:HK97 family phage prohead protease